jgi:hypothetical protein
MHRIERAGLPKFSILPRQNGGDQRIRTSGPGAALGRRSGRRRDHGNIEIAGADQISNVAVALEQLPLFGDRIGHGALSRGACRRA